MKYLIKELGSVSTGNTPSKNESSFYDSEDIGFVKPDIISDSEITEIIKTNEFISKNARKKSRIVPAGSVLVTCIGSIGKIGIARNNEYAFNQQINAIQPNDKVLPEYLAYCLLHNKQRLSDIANAPVVPIINKTQFENFEVQIAEDLETQRRQLQVLNSVSTVIRLRKEQLAELDNLVKARFVEMFGDTILNPFELPSATLEGMADIVSGITKGRKTKEQNLTEVPYMAVSNVKNGYIDWTTVKTILATEAEVKQYRLLPDDVLMTEGGDPDKLGRGAIIRKPLENCIHQNHIFRVRLNENLLLPTYFAEYLQHPKAKQYFLGCAKQTTGIASINMSQLRKLPVLVPPIDTQNDFDLFVTQVDKSKVVVQKALDEAQTLFDSLMQQYFG